MCSLDIYAHLELFPALVDEDIHHLQPGQGLQDSDNPQIAAIKIKLLLRFPTNFVQGCLCMMVSLKISWDVGCITCQGFLTRTR